MHILPRADEAEIALSKLTEYALEPIKSRGKSVAFRDVLGYTKKNADRLIDNIRRNLKNFPAEEKGDKGYGKIYTVQMELQGETGKSANVITVWLDDKYIDKMRLISVYIKKRKADIRD